MSLNPPFKILKNNSLTDFLSSAKDDNINSLFPI